MTVMQFPIAILCGAVCFALILACFVGITSALMGFVERCRWMGFGADWKEIITVSSFLLGAGFGLIAFLGVTGYLLWVI